MHSNQRYNDNDVRTNNCSIMLIDHFSANSCCALVSRTDCVYDIHQRSGKPGEILEAWMILMLN